MKHISLHGIAQDLGHAGAFGIAGGACPALCNIPCLPSSPHSFPQAGHSWGPTATEVTSFSSHPVPDGGPSGYADLHQALKSYMRFLSFF